MSFYGTKKVVVLIANFILETQILFMSFHWLKTFKTFKSILLPALENKLKSLGP